MTHFSENDPSLETQWRALILFGKNSATYKFALAKCLLEWTNYQDRRIGLKELAIPFAKNMVRHIQQADRQATSKTNSFLNACRQFNKGQIDSSELFSVTEKLAFNNVIDAFHNVHGGTLTTQFYQKDYKQGNKAIVLTDAFIRLRETSDVASLVEEVESRWTLVETAWTLGLSLKNMTENPFITALTSKNTNSDTGHITLTGLLNGYQYGKCFFSLQDISLQKEFKTFPSVSSFLPCKEKEIWNLVLTRPEINLEKGKKVPIAEYLERLTERNERLIKGEYPLSSVLIHQLGSSPKKESGISLTSIWEA